MSQLFNVATLGKVSSKPGSHLRHNDITGRSRKRKSFMSSAKRSYITAVLARGGLKSEAQNKLKSKKFRGLEGNSKFQPEVCGLP